MLKRFVAGLAVFMLTTGIPVAEAVARSSWSHFR
jgi:hypothetical protein